MELSALKQLENTPQIYDGDIMHVLYTYEFKMDSLNSNREKKGQHQFLRNSSVWVRVMTLNSVVNSGRISNSFKPLRMSSLTEV